MLLGRLLLLFTVVPLIELVLLVLIGRHVGFLNTVALVLVTGVAGATLARHEGWRTWQQIRSELGRGGVPGEALVQGALILVASVLLVTPGVLTDAVGLCCLIPPLRRRLARGLIQYLRNRVQLMELRINGQVRRRKVEARYKRVEEDRP